MTNPSQVFIAIVLISLPTVMFGGFSLLRLLPQGKLSQFQINYFRAGHAHAGVLLVLSLASLILLERTGLGTGAQWTFCLLMLVGVLAQSGGMFLHMAIGAEGQWSKGNTLTVFGAICLAAAMLLLAYGVIIA